MPSYRSIKTCAVTFGVLSIPVKLYTATEDRDISFHRYHASCRGRVNNKTWCAVDDREVGADEITRGYEWAKEHWVEITDAELDELPVPSKQTIELDGFVGFGEVDPAYVQKTYWIEPEPVGLKPYQLLRQAMLAKDVMGVAKITLRTKERICILRATPGLILVETLFWPDEVRLASVQPVPEVSVSESEMNMAGMLIDTIRMSFQPERYVDTYRAALESLIEAKKAGLPPELAPRAMPAPTVDLMDALRASLAEAKTRGLPGAVEEVSAPVKKTRSRKKE